MAELMRTSRVMELPLLSLLCPPSFSNIRFPLQFKSTPQSLSTKSMKAISAEQRVHATAFHELCESYFTEKGENYQFCALGMENALMEEGCVNDIWCHPNYEDLHPNVKADDSFALQVLGVTSHSGPTEKLVNLPEVHCEGIFQEIDAASIPWADLVPCDAHISFNDMPAIGTQVVKIAEGSTEIVGRKERNDVVIARGIVASTLISFGDHETLATITSKPDTELWKIAGEEMVLDWATNVESEKGIMQDVNLMLCGLLIAPTDGHLVRPCHSSFPGTSVVRFLRKGIG